MGGVGSGLGSSKAYLIQLLGRITVSITDTNAVLMRPTDNGGLGGCARRAEVSGVNGEGRGAGPRIFGETEHNHRSRVAGQLGRARVCALASAHAKPPPKFHLRTFMGLQVKSASRTWISVNYLIEGAH